MKVLITLVCLLVAGICLGDEGFYYPPQEYEGMECFVCNSTATPKSNTWWHLQVQKKWLHGECMGDLLIFLNALYQERNYYMENKDYIIEIHRLLSTLHRIAKRNHPIEMPIFENYLRPVEGYDKQQ